MKKKSLMTLPPSLQAEKQAIKAQEDEKKRVDALMRFTKKLCMGLEPTAENLAAIKDDVLSALCGSNVSTLLHASKASATAS